MPVTWLDLNLELGYGLPQNYPRFRIHLIMRWWRQFSQKGNLMPTYSKWICENQQLAFEASQIETTEMIEVQLVNSPFVLCNRLSEVKKRQYRTNTLMFQQWKESFIAFFKKPAIRILIWQRPL
jgi:hypothetical protein